MTASKIYEEVKNSPEMKKVYEQMSNEEKILSDTAILNLLKEFEENVLSKLEKLKNKG